MPQQGYGQQQYYAQQEQQPQDQQLQGTAEPAKKKSKTPLIVGSILGVLVVVLVLLVVVGLLKRISTTYSISNQRLHIRRGIVARKIQETRMERVQNVNINQGALQRILQIGTVDFDTAARSIAA